MTAWYDYPISQAHGVNGEQGIDLATPFHTPITALYAGTVLWAGRTAWSQGGSSGGLVEVSNNIPGKGVLVSYYLHLDTATVKPGDKVQMGQVLGLSGGQLSGGQWPVVNSGGFYSSGPHSEYGIYPAFQGPFGQGAALDPTFAITQARAGTLPITTPDGGTAGVPVPLSLTPDPNAPGDTGPTLADALLLNYLSLSASTHRAITQPAGFDGICEAIDAMEQPPDFNWRNPFGSILASMPAYTLRVVVIAAAVAVVVMILQRGLQQQAAAVTGLVGRVLSGGGASGAAGATGSTEGMLAEAPAVVAV